MFLFKMLKRNCVYSIKNIFTKSIFYGTDGRNDTGVGKKWPTEFNLEVFISIFEGENMAVTLSHMPPPKESCDIPPLVQMHFERQ